MIFSVLGPLLQYLIMLIAMTFNGYIIIAIVLGGIFGHFSQHGTRLALRNSSMSMRCQEVVLSEHKPRTTLLPAASLGQVQTRPESRVTRTTARTSSSTLSLCQTTVMVTVLAVYRLLLFTMPMSLTPLMKPHNFCCVPDCLCSHVIDCESSMLP